MTWAVSVRTSSGRSEGQHGLGPHPAPEGQMFAELFFEVREIHDLLDRFEHVQPDARSGLPMMSVTLPQEWNSTGSPASLKTRQIFL